MGKSAGNYVARGLLCCGALLLPAMAVNCNEHKDSVPAKTEPFDQPPAKSDVAPARPLQPAPETRPTATQPTGTRPAAPLPETRPEAELPKSTYDSTPPYPVALFVKTPDDKQPGWLKIEQLSDEKQLATAAGKFPEHNRIYIDTGNVRRIRIHVGHLPLRAKERVVLQIDGQGMVLSRDRQFATLELSPTGEWVILKDK